VVICYTVARERVASRADARLDARRKAEEARVQDDAGRRSEAVLRGRITEQLAPILTDFDFDFSDARFIGAPVDFVVFDGLTDVNAGAAGKLRSITFGDVKTGAAGLTKVERRIRDCLEEGRVGFAYVPVDTVW
jgi:predicted Holliday junction resolvase-like endonuclease